MSDDFSTYKWTFDRNDTYIGGNVSKIYMNNLVLAKDGVLYDKGTGCRVIIPDVVNQPPHYTSGTI